MCNYDGKKLYKEIKGSALDDHQNMQSNLNLYLRRHGLTEQRLLSFNSAHRSRLDFYVPFTFSFKLSFNGRGHQCFHHLFDYY